jgi:hypothetical protein
VESYWTRSKGLTLIDVVLILLALLSASGSRVKLVAKATEEAAAALLLLLRVEVRLLCGLVGVATGHLVDEVHVGCELGLFVIEAEL